MRYFAELAYKGTGFAGWQMQSNAVSIQYLVEEAFSTILQEKIAVTGCGRTDSGVHASQYFLHFDTSKPVPSSLFLRLNKFLPPDIAIKAIWRTTDNAHARFDALKRTYQYFLHRDKDPFLDDRSLYYPHYALLDRKAVEKATGLLLDYDRFYPFCKANTDTQHFKCMLDNVGWAWETDRAIFTISANRFIRGMVRLIVGMCLQVGRGKLEIGTVREALDTQQRIQRASSAAANGLFLQSVEYPPDTFAEKLF